MRFADEIKDKIIELLYQNWDVEDRSERDKHWVDALLWVIEKQFKKEAKG